MRVLKMPRMESDNIFIWLFFLMLAIMIDGCASQANPAIGNSVIEVGSDARPNIVIAYNSFTVGTLNLYMQGSPDVAGFLDEGVKVAMRSGFIGGGKKDSLIDKATLEFEKPITNIPNGPGEPLTTNELTQKSEEEVEIVSTTEKPKEVDTGDDVDLDALCKLCNSKYGSIGSRTTPEPDYSKIHGEFANGRPQIGRPIFGPTIGRNRRSVDSCEKIAENMLRSGRVTNGTTVGCSSCGYDIVFKEDPTIPKKRSKRSSSMNLSVMASTLKEMSIGRCPSDLPSKHGGSKTQSCQHWLSIQWDQTKKTFCMLHESCGLGEILEDGVCVTSKSNTVQSTVCSDDNFRISSHVVLPNPTVPDFEDPNVCEILSHKLKKCKTDHLEMRRVSIVGFNGKEHLVTVHHDFTMVENLASSMNYICSKCATLSCSNCKGDVYYTSNFNTDQSGVCYCQLKSKPKFGTVNLIIGGQPYPIDYYISTYTTVGLRPKTDSSQGPVLEDCPSCVVQCDGTSVSFHSFPDNVGIVKMCSGTFCRSQNYTQSIRVPPHFLVLQNNLLITVVSISGTVVKRDNVVCPIRNSCDLVNCHLCINKLINPSCYDAIDSALVVVMLIIAFLVVTLIYRLLASMLIILKIAKIFFRFLTIMLKALIAVTRAICGYSVARSKRIYRKIEQVGEGETIEIVTQRDFESVSKEPKRLPRLMSPGERRVLSEMVPLTSSKPSTYAFSILLVLIVILTDPVCTCSQVSHLSFEDKNCEISNDKMVCTPTNKVVFNLGGLGADACVLVSKGETVMGTLQVRISAIKSRCVASTLYWTYQHSSHVQTQCQCNTFDMCSNNCAKSVSGIDKELLSELSLKHGVGPGLSSCLEVPNHYLGACVLPVNTCCFYVAELPPILPVRALKVEVCNSFLWEVEVKLKTFFSDLSTESKQVLTAGEELVKDSVSLLITQVSSPTIPSQSKCLVTDHSSNTSYLAECNKEGELSTGKLGVIKCSSLDMAMNNQKNCSFARSLINITPGSNSLYSQVQTLDFDKLLMGKALPLETSGFYVNKDDRGYYFKRSFSETFSLQLGLPSVTALVYSKQATCNLIFYHLRGCFSCLEGAVTTFHSTCTSYPVVGLLKCPSLPGSIPIVVNKQGNFTVKLSFNSSRVSDDCSYTLGKTSGSIKLSGLLVELIHSSEGFGTETQINRGNSTGSFGFSFDGLKSIGQVLLSWWKSLWDLVLMVVLILIALAGSIFLIKIFTLNQQSTVKLNLKQV